ncbi:MAG: carbohydrate binding family 9 domain-containing protein [Candidatus Zixiibacteriota bacterium]|nr:MAG: carbohydrate binding family 9 domain-containing protein [candidate division Zixibacteria bacterium]
MTLSTFQKTLRGLLIITAGILLIVVPTAAKRTFQPVFNPSIFVSKAAATISIDGNLDDHAWSLASSADNFVERSPGDMTEPEVQTRALITYDEDHLYVAFLCYDDPSAIRATMSQRDQYGGDDEVCLLVDTYGDASWAYEFFVNPYGVQKDRLWSSVGGEDQGFDLIWQSAAQVTDSGYQVEIAIPFSSMRFPSKDVQSWKVDFWRNRPRESFKQYSWAAYDRDNQCWVCQMGTVDGIENVRSGKGLELLPTFVANQSGNLVQVGDEEFDFDNSDPDGEFSLGAKYSISSNIVAEGAYNPDFSQIESDAAQIDVNTTIALFYPERRPFFQEGSDLFRTLFNSFYTRTINDPQLALKFIGRTDRNSFGILSAIDDNTPYMIPLEESSILINTGRSTANVIRGMRTIRGNSQVGFILTDRRFEDGGSGSIAAGDYFIRVSRSYILDGQFILSHTREPDNQEMTQDFDGMTFDNGEHTVAFDGESFFGHAFIARLLYMPRNFGYILNYNEVSPSYRTETGYDPTMDYRDASVFTRYRFEFNNSIFQTVTPQIYFQRRWSFDGPRKFGNLNFAVNASTTVAQTNVTLAYQIHDELYRGVEFEDLRHIDFDINSQLSDKLGCYLSFERGKSIARRFLLVGDETSIDAGLDLKPFDRLVIEPNLSYARSVSEETGVELYSGYITRTRLRFQANKELSVRLVVQYDDFYERWDIDPLITYRISPFSVFYAGSTYDYANLQMGPDGQRDWKLSSRQFFMKLQYLFQI